MGMLTAKHALLVMGGIGDLLHYVVRIPDFLRRARIEPSSLHVFVESLVPDQAEAICAAALPGITFTYLSPALHWANTFPLLSPGCGCERLNRPAYRYIRRLGFEHVEDWFLPFLCSGYKVDVFPLLRLVQKVPRPDKPCVIVSLRDKGFLWWPTRELCETIHALLWRTYDLIYIGTPSENIPGLDHLATLRSAVDALALSFNADLFIGTDTGLATIRELMAKKNVYCISPFWLEELMIRYGYLDGETLRRTKSVFAFNPADLMRLISAEVLGRERHT
jgi:hypothetical protein